LINIFDIYTNECAEDKKRTLRREEFTKKGFWKNKKERESNTF